MAHVSESKQICTIHTHTRTQMFLFCTDVKVLPLYQAGTPLQFLSPSSLQSATRVIKFIL